jgi:hypothetical protein
MGTGILQSLLALALLSPASGAGQSNPPPIGSVKPLEFNEVAPQFGGTSIAKTSKQKIIAISNVSDAPVLVLQIQATDDFEQGNTCHTWLPEGSTCLIQVLFTPSAEGVRTGRLYVDGVTTSPSGEPAQELFDQSIPLTGYGLVQEDLDKEVETREPHDPARTTNEEEQAKALLDDQTSTFEDLLAKDARAVANSEKIFALTMDTDRRLRIASILASIGVKDKIYSDYLMGEAEKALKHDHDMPWPFLYSEDGSKQSAANPRLIDWCQRYRRDFWEIEKMEVYEIPNAWYFLGASGDPRSYDVLERGLHSPNLMIVVSAAQGLAKLQDPRAIDELIAVGHHLPGEVRALIAESLLLLSMPEAQAAAEELAPEKERLKLQRDDIQARGIKVLFPW